MNLNISTHDGVVLTIIFYERGVKSVYNKIFGKIMRCLTYCVFLLFCSLNCLCQSNTITHNYENYQITLSVPLITHSEGNQLVLSVYREDLPLSKLMLNYEGSIKEFFVDDIDMNGNFEIILLFRDTLKNIKIFSWRDFYLFELKEKVQPNTNNHISKVLKIERKNGKIIRKVELIENDSLRLLNQRFCFRELRWCQEKESD